MQHSLVALLLFFVILSEFSGSAEAPDGRESEGINKQQFSGAPATQPRSKRSWIFPGTRWCGTGSNAHNYHDLGMFDKTDQCCREHDHCQHTIYPFRVKYGVFNHHVFTVSHCDCDRRFHQCLLDVNSSVSSMVGFSFFNVLKVPCFRLTQKLHCTQLSWWGKCKSTQVAPYAVFKNPAQYNSTQTSPKDKRHRFSILQQDSTRSPTTTAPSVTPVSKPACQKPLQRCAALDRHQGHTFRAMGGKRRQRKLCAEHADTTSTQRPMCSTAAPVPKSNTVARKCHNSNLDKRLKPPSRHKEPLSDSHQTAEQDTTHKDKLHCSYYKRLDKCRYKIYPLEKRYGLHNHEIKTLYHCNCTHRLAREVSQQKEISLAQYSLLEMVSMSCFTFNCPQKNSHRCLAILSRVKEMKRLMSRWCPTNGKASASKMKSRNARKRKLSSVKLYDRCLRISSSKSKD